MVRLRFLSIFTGLLWGLLITLPVHTSAQSLEKPRPADVRLIIDISGSMKRNDPANLRRPALELLVKLLPEGSKAGVWTFGKNVNMLIPHRPVAESWRKAAGSQARKINSVGLFTNIGEALERAAYDLDHPDDKYRTSLILLTDGLVDISRDPAANQAEWRRIVDEVLPKFAEAGYTIHTVALSDNADAELMNRLAIATDGISAVAKSADELMKIFLRAFDQAVPAEQVPLEENRFVIDSSIEEFTALIFRHPGSAPTQLIGPDHHHYKFERERQDVSWYKTDDYDLITVKRPLEGEWKVKADLDPDSRVTIVSDIKLRIKPLKSNLYSGESLDVAMLLEEEGKTLTRADFLRLLTIDSEVSQVETGQRWNQSLSEGLPPGDGIFRTTYDVFETEGGYDFKLVVDGKSFKREFSHALSVHQPFGVKLENDSVDGKPQYRVTVSSNSPDIDIAATKVVARVKDPNGRSAIKPLTLTEVDNWRLVIDPEHQGQYLVNLRVNATDTSGNAFEFTPEPVRFHYPDSNDPFAEQASEPEPLEADEPEPQPEPEPAPTMKPEPEQPVAKAPEPKAANAAENNNLLLYTAIGIGNLLIVILAFFAYRVIMGNKGDESLKDIERAMEETAAEADKPLETTPPEPAVLEDPAMAEVPVEEAGGIEAVAEPEADETLANSLLDSDLDLSSDSEDGLTVTELDDDYGDGDDAESSDEEELFGQEFSLDDFAPDEESKT